MSERKARRYLFDTIREIRPYLQDPERVFKFKTDDLLHIYIVLRDTEYKYDLWIQIEQKKEKL